MRKLETKPRKNRRHGEDELTHFYTNQRGMVNRVVSFRMNAILYDRLFQYSTSVDKDVGECIREAVGIYLRERTSSGPPIPTSTTPQTVEDNGLNAWQARSKKV